MSKGKGKGEGVLTYDDLEEAFVGLVLTPFEEYPVRACYDLDLSIQSLVKGGGSECTYEEAEEHLYYNTLGAYFGKGTPVFLSKMSLEEAEALVREREE